MDEVFIGFQNSQIAVRTNMSAITHFVRESHAPMLVASAPNLIRTIEVMKVENGFRLGDDTFAVDAEPFVLFDLLRQTIQKEFVAALSGTIWLHSGAVAQDDTAILIAGTSTSGKSTLVTHLMSLGFRYMSDELVGISPDATVTGFPRIPVRRKRSDRDLTRIELGSLGRETIRVDVNGIHNGEASIGAVVFCQYEHEAPTTLAALSSGETAMRLFQTLLNFNDAKEAALAVIASIARTVPAYALTFSDADDAARSILQETQSLTKS